MSIVNPLCNVHCMQLTQSYASGYPGDQKASAGYMWVIARIQRRIIKDLGESNKNILFTCKTKFPNQMEEGGVFISS